MAEVSLIELKKKLVLDDLTFNSGDLVDAIRINEDFYKVFTANGWWMVPAAHFTTEQENGRM